MEEGFEAVLSRKHIPQTTCLTAIRILGNPLRSFDISWVAPSRAQYYLADRSNAGIDVIATDTLTFQRTITKGSPTGQCPTCKFVGIVLTTFGRREQQSLRAGWRYTAWPLALCR